MTKFAIVLIKPPGYTHSEAFREIAELTAYGLQRAGYDVIWSDTSFLSDRVPIVFGANLLQHPAQISPHAIIYNLEQFDRQSIWINDDYINVLKSHLVWEYSKINIELMRARGITNVTHMPIGYEPELTRIAAAETQDIDVLFFGSVNPRRQKIIDDLKKSGINVVSAFNVYGKERDALISRSKIVINIHFYETKIFEIVRVSYLLSNKVCVVSEDGDESVKAEFSQALVFAPYDELVRTCIDLLGDEKRRNQVADRGLNLMKSRPQNKIFFENLQNMFVSTPVSLSYPKVLNIGSGKDRRPDCVNLDVSGEWNPDLLYDLNQPLPDAGVEMHTERFGSIYLGDEVFDLILCHDVLEHLVNLTQAMTTCLRLLKVGGSMRITVPYDLSYGAWQDPTHVRAFNERSWLYYTDWFWYLNWATHRFEMKSLQFVLSPIGQALNSQNVPQDVILRTPRAIDAMKVELVKRKLTPEEVEIYQSRHNNSK